MTGLLIVPNWFFLNVAGNLKQDFAGWQLVCADTESGRAFCGEIAGGVAIGKDDVFHANLAWQAERPKGESWKRVPPGPIIVPINEHTGACHDDGGCHFEPSLNFGVGVRFILTPPGSMEQGDDAEEAAEWIAAKEVATAVAA